MEYIALSIVAVVIVLTVMLSCIYAIVATKESSRVKEITLSIRYQGLECTKTTKFYKGGKS